MLSREVDRVEYAFTDLAQRMTNSLSRVRSASAARRRNDSMNTTARKDTPPLSSGYANTYCSTSRDSPSSLNERHSRDNHV